LTADLSGHSMRIGAAQDMIVAGFDALAVHAGWRLEVGKRRAAIR